MNIVSFAIEYVVYNLISSLNQILWSAWHKI